MGYAYGITLQGSRHPEGSPTLAVSIRDSVQNGRLTLEALLGHDSPEKQIEIILMEISRSFNAIAYLSEQTGRVAETNPYPPTGESAGGDYFISKAEAFRYYASEIDAWHFWIGALWHYAESQLSPLLPPEAAQKIRKIPELKRWQTTQR